MTQGTPSAPTALPAAAPSTLRTARHTAFVFAGNLGATALGFLANIILMRRLGPEGFGVVVVATTFLSVLWQFTGRGLEQAMVRLVAQARDGEATSSDREAFQATHRAKLLWGAVLSICGCALAAPAAHFFIGPSASAAPFLFAALASLAASLWGYTGGCLQATQAFRSFSALQFLNAAGRLVLTVSLLLIAWLTPTSAMLATLCGYGLAAIVGYLLIPRGARGLNAHPHLNPVLWRLSRWLIASSLIYLLYTRLDQLILSRLAGPAAAGTYGAAITFIQLLDLVTGSLLTVVLPQICAVTQSDSLRRRTWHAVRVSALFALPMIALLPLAPSVMHLLMGPRFGPAIPLFMIIVPGALLNLITHPLQAVLHARARTSVLTALDIGVLGFNGIANYMAIRARGVQGAAIIALITRCLSSILLVAIVVRELKRTQNESGDNLGDAGQASIH